MALSGLHISSGKVKNCYLIVDQKLCDKKRNIMSTNSIGNNSQFSGGQ